MQLTDIKKGMTVRVIDRDNQYYLQQGDVLSIMHELIPGKIHIRLCFDESGDVIPGYQPEQLDWE